MRDKVLLRVRIPATQLTYQFRVPYDLFVCQAADLMAEVLGRREAGLFEACEGMGLMLLDGDDAGLVLDPLETVRSLVARQAIVDGSSVALV